MSITLRPMRLFQSAPPCGERPYKTAYYQQIALFQSAPPAESDVYAIRDILARICFNPRPPAESDHSEFASDRLRWVSIRAPLRRATTPCLRSMPLIASFNPRPPAESDPVRLTI